jgi:nucleotidyltransferase/DNA polymerase involved in DNA repair
MSIHTRSETLEDPTDSVETMKRTVKELLERFFSQEESKARRVGVKISNFVKEQENQRQLTSFIENTKD